MDQIGEYLLSNLVMGLLVVSVGAAAVAMVIVWVFNQFFEVKDD